MKKNFYELLEIGENASQEEIKKAYKKKAVEHHPDKNNGSKESEEMFKSIQEAYSTLSDEQKRRNYDQFGDQNGNPNPFAGGFEGFGDMNNIFNDFFGGFGGSGQQRQKTKRGSDVGISVEIDFNEILNGINKKIKIKRNNKCDVCDGLGGKDEINCGTCGGKGHRINVQRTPFGNIQNVSECNICNGSGKITKDKCKKCTGNGVMLEEQQISFDIPRGVYRGMQFVMKGFGNYAKRGVFGDLIININEKEDKKFKREGENLIAEMDLNVLDSIMGKKIKFRTLDKILDISIPQGINNKETIKLNGEGLPFYNSDRRGDLYIKINLKLPKKIEPEDIDLIDQLRISKTFKSI